MDAVPYAASPTDQAGVKAEPSSLPTGDPTADQTDLTPQLALGNQQAGVVGVGGDGGAPMVVSAVPSQDSLMPEVSLQVHTICTHT